MKPHWIALFAALTFSGMTYAKTPTAPATLTPPASDDPFLWLEDIHGAKPMAWVEQQNAVTAKRYVDSAGFTQVRDRVLEVMDSEARIPMVEKLGAYYYNFWRDQQHPRGLWRRTTLAEYRKDNPQWETVLDVDALGQAEGKRWVFKGAQCLKPDYTRCLVSLSPDGGDASAVREFDLTSKQFVQGGFELPAAKSQVAWIDRDHIYVGTDFGPGSMTESSYPRIVKAWTRGTPLTDATLVYEGKSSDMSVSAYRDNTPGYVRDFVVRQLAFYDSETYLRGSDGKLRKLDVPNDAITDVQREWLLIEPRTAWTVDGKTYTSGSLLVAKFDDFIAGKRALTELFVPTARTSLAEHSWTRHHLILNVMDDVVSKLEVLTPQADGSWKRQSLGGAPALSTIEAGGIDADDSDDYFLTVSGYLQPTTLYYGTLGQGEAAPLKHSPAFFDASKYQVSQHFVASKDGTRVPYFEIAPKGLKADGKNPTLLYGYGGFEVSLQPAYSGSIGRSWLDRGGVYVIANIRGGGEYGPRWHQAALKANRLRAYEDFAAVAEDLAKRKITSPAHLGAEGGSNGGLLMGNMLTLYPQLFGGIVCEVPLLDMKRYIHLSAGASWMAEYGDPDQPDQWAFIKTFSPYQNLKPGISYPPTLFYTATSDDRVGPVQARKMAAKMDAMGYTNVLFYENTEGGHGAAADNKQSAFRVALTTEFLWDKLK
jgi:prolyl oligopeptidase